MTTAAAAAAAPLAAAAGSVKGSQASSSPVHRTAKKLTSIKEGGGSSHGADATLGQRSHNNERDFMRRYDAWLVLQQEDAADLAARVRTGAPRPGVGPPPAAAAGSHVAIHVISMARDRQPCRPLTLQPQTSPRIITQPLCQRLFPARASRRWMHTPLCQPLAALQRSSLMQVGPGRDPMYVGMPCADIR